MVALIEGCEHLAERIVICTHNKTLEDVETGSMYQAREPSFRLLYLNQPVDAAARFLNGGIGGHVQIQPHRASCWGNTAILA